VAMLSLPQDPLLEVYQVKFKGHEDQD